MKRWYFKFEYGEVGDDFPSAMLGGYVEWEDNKFTKTSTFSYTDGDRKYSVELPFDTPLSEGIAELIKARLAGKAAVIA